MITDLKCQKYFIMAKKHLRRQIHESKCLSQLNFVFFYTSGRENKKTDSLIHWENNSLANNQDYWKQYLLKIILLFEKHEISFINLDKSRTSLEKVIQANLVDFYCQKIRKSIKTSYSIEDINNCHLLDWSVDMKNDIWWFDCFWVSDNL